MRNFLLREIDLTEAELTRFMKITNQRFFKKGTVFFTPEKLFDRLFFIEEGMTRCYRLRNGEDITYHFYLEQEFCVDFYSYLNGSLSDFFFEALVDTSVYEISKSAMTQVMKDIPALERLGRLMAEKAYSSVAERLRELQVDGLEARYSRLLTRNPALFQAIQQRHIATYLGVKPESLSRIKAQLYKRR